MPFARWQSTIVDEFGNIVQQPTIEVRRETVGQPLATLYSDRDGAVPLGNPFTLSGGDNGFAAFHVAGGAYQITVTKGLFSRTYRYVAIGLVAESDALVSNFREVLTASRNYYVRTDGSDSNNGLANTSGGAFLTIQKALDVAAALDTSIYSVTINVGAGTFSGTGSNTLKPALGAGTISVVGAGPGSTIVSRTNGNCFYAVNANSSFNIADLSVTTTTSGAGLYCYGSGLINFQNVDFRACAGVQLRAESGGSLVASGNYGISGGASYHALAGLQGAVGIAGRTLTITNTPAFSLAFGGAVRQGYFQCNGATFSGSATGPRYAVTTGGIIERSGSDLPGNSAGSAASPGVYI